MPLPWFTVLHMYLYPLNFVYSFWPPTTLQTLISSMAFLVSVLDSIFQRFNYVDIMLILVIKCCHAAVMHRLVFDIQWDNLWASFSSLVYTCIKNECLLQRAIEEGTDFIETDILSSKDGVLICFHDVTLDNTTDIAKYKEFANRKRTYEVQGVNTTGFFTGTDAILC